MIVLTVHQLKVPQLIEQSIEVRFHPASGQSIAGGHGLTDLGDAAWTVQQRPGLCSHAIQPEALSGLHVDEDGATGDGSGLDVLAPHED
jgi:hypothetical protein